MGMVTCGLVRCWRRTPLWGDVDSPLRKFPSWLHHLSDMSILFSPIDAFIFSSVFWW